jgi:hypothetical protein
MSHQSSYIRNAMQPDPRRRVTPLVLSLSAALAISQTAIATVGSAPRSDRKAAGSIAAQGPRTLTVANCDDAGPNSLRDMIKNVAQSGDTIDLSTLNCSLITLTTGELEVAQDDLTIAGSGADRLTISAAGNSRVLNHKGVGTLSLSGITLNRGYYRAAAGAYAYGGCIYSTGGVRLTNTYVHDCTAAGDTGFPRGGAVYAQGVWLDHSTISLSTVLDTSQPGGNCVNSNDCGSGGVDAGNILISDYSAISLSTGGGTCGAAQARTMLIIGSTIDHNQAAENGALCILDSTSHSLIQDSTISSNLSTGGAPGNLRSTAIYSKSSDLTILNSTIAFNHETTDLQPAVAILGNGQGTVIRSSIIALNGGNNYVPWDLYVKNPGAGLTGSSNLIIDTNVAIPGFIKSHEDPKLGPLQTNGGPTKTHMLMSGSPAIGMGDNLGQLPYEQRGVNYPRATGVAASVDIGAVQFDEIFVWSD